VAEPPGDQPHAFKAPDQQGLFAFSAYSVKVISQLDLEPCTFQELHVWFIYTFALIVTCNGSADESEAA
jgi:hypothetical protein